MAVSETWRDVPGYGGKYQASDMGHIANTFWHGQKRKNGGRTILTQYKRKPRGKAKLQSMKRYVHLTDLEGNMQALAALQGTDKISAAIISIAQDGRVDPGEDVQMGEILAYMKNVATAAEAMQLWIKKNLKGEACNGKK